MERYVSLFKEASQFVYHVTLTKNIPKIKKSGLLMFQTTNWVKGSGERYGEGDVYAFENFTDAVSWGAKMEWDFKTKKPEDISIIKIKRTNEWKIDTNDPIGQLTKKGNWLHTSSRVDPKDIKDTIKLTRDLVRRFVADEDLTNEF